MDMALALKYSTKKKSTAENGTSRTNAREFL
jgi:hypothetical protein